MSLQSRSVLPLTDIRAGEEEEEEEEPAAAAGDVRAVMTTWQININVCLFVSFVVTHLNYWSQTVDDD